jgi:uncharacterized protein YydD (DUF2326 family)
VKDGVVSAHIEKDGNVVAPNFDKVGKTLFGNIEAKAKLLTKRIKNMQKLKGLENATLKTAAKKPHQLQVVGDKEALKEHGKEGNLEDIERSLSKFNDRADILAIYLNGPITLGEAVSAIINGIKETFEEKKKELKISIKDGKPKIEGLPENVEDFFPEVIARAWELLKATFDFLVDQKDSLPELDNKLKAICEEAKEMAGKLKDAASGENLSPGELLKAGRALSGNIKQLGQAPAIVVQLLKTLQETSVQLSSGVTGRQEKNDGAAA